jgi:hypothetical protein
MSQEKRKGFLDNFPVFESGSIKILFWDVWNFLFSAYFLFMIPIESFVLLQLPNMEKANIYQQEVVIFGIVTFCIDLVLQFNISYFTEGVMVQDRKKIFYHQLYFQFPINLICIIVLIINHVFSPNRFSIIPMIFLFKIIVLWKLGDKIDDLIRNRFYLKSCKQIFSNLLIVLFLGHLFSAIFMGISIYTIQVLKYPVDVSWVGSYNIYTNGKHMYGDTIYEALTSGKGKDSSEWIVPYMYGIYWSISMIITLGSNIAPCNPHEVIFQIISEFVSCICWGFLL